MSKLRVLLSSILALLLALPSSALSQSRGSNNWSILRVLQAGDKLELKLKNGKTLTAEFSALSDTALKISRGSKTVDVQRDEILRVDRVYSKHVLKSTAIGTGIGAALGAGLGGSLGNCNYNCSFSKGAMAVAGAVIFAVPGAVVGLIVGVAHQDREFLYEL